MKNLNLINHIETAKSRLKNIRYHSLDSVTDGKGNKLKVWREDKWITDEYPFTEDNISIVHNHLLFFLFSLDLRDEELQPSDFIESFAGGYKEGLKFLDNEGIFLNDIADQNRRKNLLEILKRIIHERNFKGNTLLKKVYGNLPLIWNERNIREYGKYHGIITAIDRMAKRAGIDAKDLQKDGVKAKSLEFKDLFTNESDCKKVTKALSEYINPETMVWIDEKKGYKSVASSLIKFIHSKGYFNAKPTNEEIEAICKNSFKIDVGIDTVKRSKPEKYNFSKLQI